ncbi:LamG domain-containing protein [Marinobacter salarius]|jgi:hypothetical protein|uniref:LamG domain-containing protein n=1 Tax=Marinobacter salarius TaxID=1420917 RepID=UPI0010AAE229|nr:MULTISPECIES: LamG domain-containing protein [Marinobacter]MBJ7302566.1 LamG domain-containing protein [Marinobacter salarius]HIO30717.1 LamG domain-containing protein [Marinobacter salarius]HIP01784.1 LamG domain-containing protein [Marinobacter salarius]
MSKYADLASAVGDGLVHYWLMDETSGTALADLIGEWSANCFGDSFSGSDLTPSEYDAMIVSTPAGYGRHTSVNWDGTSGGISKLAAIKLDQSPLDPSFSEITLRIRYFHTSRVEDVRSAQSMTLAYLGELSNSGLLIDVANGSVYLSAGNEDSGSTNIPDPFVVGEWHDVVIAGDATSTDFYVNGTLAHSLTGSNSFLIYNTATYTNSSFIGAAPDGNYYLAGTAVDGVFQDACIWNRKLTPTEITGLHSDGTAEPLVADPSPITYDAVLDATLPIEADFSAQVDPVLAELDVVFPISFRAPAYQDWVSKIPPAQLQEVYRLVITGAADGLDDLYIGGISSWQATNQAGGRSSYVQAVIPAADQYLADISDRQGGDLVIQKGYRFADGQVQYDEIMRSRFDTLRPDRGQRALTVTVSGYMPDNPTSTGARTLTGVRSISVSNGQRRVRCNIDLFLQPGMTVTALDETFTADYINYYVSGTDKFCEVSER